MQRIAIGSLNATLQVWKQAEKQSLSCRITADTRDFVKNRTTLIDFICRKAGSIVGSLMRGTLDAKIPSVIPTNPLEIGIGVATIKATPEVTVMEIDNMSHSDVEHWFADVITG